MKKLLTIALGGVMFLMVVAPVMADQGGVPNNHACFGQGRSDYALNGEYSVGYWASMRKGNNAQLNHDYMDSCLVD